MAAKRGQHRLALPGQLCGPRHRLGKVTIGMKEVDRCLRLGGGRVNVLVAHAIGINADLAGHGLGPCGEGHVYGVKEGRAFMNIDNRAKHDQHKAQDKQSTTGPAAAAAMWGAGGAWSWP